MRSILLTLLLITLFTRVSAQNEQDSFVIVTIEMKSSSRLHPFESDYWVIPLTLWKDSEEEVIPLYIGGFSQTDINECCISDTLIMFNPSTNESFEFKRSFLESLNALRNSVIKKRRKVQTVRKKWDGYKEGLSVYLTPIKGIFCLCEIKYKNDNSKSGYKGKIAIPFGQTEINPGFWDTQKFKEIRRFDFSALPFISLHTMQ